MQRTLLLLSLFASTIAIAQPLELSQYSARFEQRQLWEFTPQLLLFEQIISPKEELLQVSLSALSSVVRRSISDEVVKNVVADFSIFGSDIINKPDQFDNNQQFLFSNTLQTERLRYRMPSKFRGYRISTDNQLFHNFGNPDNKLTNIQIAAGYEFFGGKGRIEYAEDALLANWLADALVSAGVSDEVNQAQRSILARGITKLVGNRTFDLRRRRIYELSTLYELLDRAHITVADEYLALAIINDNWVFANRAELPHGSRFLGGLSTTQRFQSASATRNAPEFIRHWRPQAGLFTEYQHAKIVGNQGSLQYFGRLDLTILHQSTWRDDQDKATNSHPLLIPKFGIDYIYLPTSRTRVDFITEIFATLPAAADNTLIKRTVTWENSLDIAYLISYQWELGFTFSLSHFRNFATEEVEWLPFIGISNQITLF